MQYLNFIKSDKVSTYCGLTYREYNIMYNCYVKTLNMARFE